MDTDLKSPPLCLVDWYLTRVFFAILTPNKSGAVLLDLRPNQGRGTGHKQECVTATGKEAPDVRSESSHVVAESC